MKFNHIWKIFFFLCVCITILSCEKNPSYQTTGYVEANYIYLSCPYGGYLQELLIDYGQSVQKGQLILKLNPEPQQEQVTAAQAKWRAAQDNFAELKKNKQYVSQHKIDAMQEEVIAALANLKTIEWTYAIKSVTAPFAGTIADIYFQQGEYVPPLHPIASLFVPSKMRIVFYVPETNLNKVKVHKQIYVLLANRRYPTTIIIIAKKAEFTAQEIFSEENRNKLVYKITAEVPVSLQSLLNAGQPVDINYE